MARNSKGDSQVFGEEGSAGPPRDLAAELLESDDFGWIDGLEFRSRRRSQDLYSGQHRSSLLGGCTEFADHRPYHPGDPLRRMDWRLLAKRDRHYIKRFEDERTVSTLIVLDRSGSMSFGLSTQDKFSHALRTAACIARLLLGHRDPVGLASWDEKGDGVIVQPRSVPSHFEALFETVSGLPPPSGPTRLTALADLLIPLFPNRMRLIILSDGFMESEKFERTLRTLAIRGHEVIFGHVLAPEETTFQFEQGMRFVDLEAKDSWLDIDPIVYRESYLKRFEVFLEEVLSLCGKLGCGYFRLLTDEPAGAALAAFLRRWNVGNLAPVLGPDHQNERTKTQPK